MPFGRRNSRGGGRGSSRSIPFQERQVNGSDAEANRRTRGRRAADDTSRSEQRLHRTQRRNQRDRVPEISESLRTIAAYLRETRRTVRTTYEEHRLNWADMASVCEEYMSTRYPFWWGVGNRLRDSIRMRMEQNNDNNNNQNSINIEEYNDENEPPNNGNDDENNNRALQDSDDEAQRDPPVGN